MDPEIEYNKNKMQEDIYIYQLKLMYSMQKVSIMTYYHHKIKCIIATGSKCEQLFKKVPKVLVTPAVVTSLHFFFSQLHGLCWSNFCLEGGEMIDFHENS